MDPHTHTHIVFVPQDETLKVYFVKMIQKEINENRYDLKKIKGKILA